MAHSEDASDQNLPKMLWFGVEPLVAANPALALDYAGRSRMPMLARFIARRAVDADAVDAVVAALGKSPAAAHLMLEGMRDGLDGRYDVPAPAGWPPVYERLEQSDAALARLASGVNQQFSDANATSGNVQIVRSRTASIDDRRKALQTLTLQRRPQLAPVLPALLDEAPLRADAIRSVGV